MKFELTVYELGQALKKINEKYKLEVLFKINLSGGWMTASGEALIEEVPVLNATSCKSRSNNIINVRIKGKDDENFVIKLTGAKGSKFNIDLSKGRYKILSPLGLNLNQIKVNEEECKLRIDEDIIFKIKCSVEEVKKFIEE